MPFVQHKPIDQDLMAVACLLASSSKGEALEVSLRFPPEQKSEMTLVGND